MDSNSKQKLEALNNPKVMEYVEEAIKLCRPAKVTVITDSKDDIEYVRKLAKENGEERALKTDGHTIHFDGPKDQARDKTHTKYLLEKEVDWGININYILKKEGLPEVISYFDGIMEGKEMIISFYCLGPTNSPFSLPAMQITDSAYVTHSEQILYRSGYEEFKRLKGAPNFFYFLHSAGRLDNGVTIDVDKRRIYIDLDENRVYTVNNQYAGNSVGLKKLAFRLAIQKAQKEGWLAEHMFLMGVHGKPGRTTYFTGAFPSACGKTSTAMLPGQSIIGDDIAYLRKTNGKVHAVNVEKGIFGIIQDVNPQDDPLIYDALTTPREVIFSNVLINDDMPYWLGMGKEVPAEGENFSGQWYKGKKDEKGNDIPYANKNARYTIAINELENADPELDNPEGVPVKAIVYGGRDSDTTVPVVESLTWEHGVFLGATIESETTAATLGKEGVRQHNPMANLDFISVPFDTYLENHLQFPKGLSAVPTIYSVNYFLKNDEGKFCNGKLDKKIWILWAEGRVNGEYEAIDTPVGKIPKYEDLKVLFKKHLDYDYTEKEYQEQFSIRIAKYLAKMGRMTEAFNKFKMPTTFATELNNQIKRLKDAQAKFGDVAAPEVFLK